MTASMRDDVLDKLAASIPQRELGQPDDIAQSVAFIFDKDYFTGWSSNVTVGFAFDSAARFVKRLAKV